MTESSDQADRPSRVGLSSYTTQRLAELRARRAELDSEGKTAAATADAKPAVASNGVATSSSVATSVISSTSSSSQDAYRVQRSASLASDTTDSVPSAKPASSLYRNDIRELKETSKSSEVLASNNSACSESKFKSSASSLASKEVIFTLVLMSICTSQLNELQFC